MTSSNWAPSSTLCSWPKDVANLLEHCFVVSWSWLWFNYYSWHLNFNLNISSYGCDISTKCSVGLMCRVESLCCKIDCWIWIHWTYEISTISAPLSFPFLIFKNMSKNQRKLSSDRYNGFVIDNLCYLSCIIAGNEIQNWWEMLYAFGTCCYRISILYFEKQIQVVFLSYVHCGWNFHLMKLRFKMMKLLW